MDMIQKAHDKMLALGKTIVMGLKQTTTLSSPLTKYNTFRDFHLDTLGLIPKYGIDFF